MNYYKIKLLRTIEVEISVLGESEYEVKRKYEGGWYNEYIDATSNWVCLEEKVVDIEEEERRSYSNSPFSGSIEKYLRPAQLVKDRNDRLELISPIDLLAGTTYIVDYRPYGDVLPYDPYMTWILNYDGTEED